MVWEACRRQRLGCKARFYDVNRLTYFLSPDKTIGLIYIYYNTIRIYCVYFRNSNFIDFLPQTRFPLNYISTRLAHSAFQTNRSDQKATDKCVDPGARFHLGNSHNIKNIVLSLI